MSMYAPYLTGGDSAIASLVRTLNQLIDNMIAAGVEPVAGSVTDESVAADAAIAQAKIAGLVAALAALTATDATLIPLSQKAAANGVATLGADSKIPGAQLPSLAIGETFTVASQAAMLALTAQRGDIAVRTDLNPDGFFLLTSDSPATLADWVQVTAPGAVVSVNGQTGAVDLSGTYADADDTAEALAERLVAAKVVLPGAPVVGAVVETNPTAIPLGKINGVVYGRGVADFDGIYSLGEDGVTWTLAAEPAAGIAEQIHLMPDGEVLVIGSSLVRRSTGWATNPLTATWATKATPTTDASFQLFGTAVHENLVLITEYANPRLPSVKAILSTDGGQTFTTVRNLKTMHPGQEELVHWHGAGIDPLTTPNPRLWLSWGDGPRGIIYSDDLGATWSTHANDEQPTVLHPTPLGMVAGSDMNPDGVFRIIRTADPDDMTYEQILMLRYGQNVTASTYGFAMHAWTDPDTGLIYMTFRSDLEGVPATVVATDGMSASIIYETPPGGPTGETQPKVGQAIVHDGELLFWYRLGADYFLVRGGEVRYGSPTPTASPGAYADNGASLGAADRSSVGIGANVVAQSYSTIIGDSAVQSTGAQEATAIGETAEAGEKAVAVGRGAEASGDQSTALGHTSTATAESATAIGHSADATGTNATAVGGSAQAAALAAVAVGYAASAAHQAAVVVGSASVTGVNGVAMGNAASAGQFAAGLGYDADAADHGVAVGESTDAQPNAVAVGNQAQATDWFGVAVGYQTSAALSSTAVGDQAKATNLFAVAVGSGSQTSANSQIAGGARHVELGEVADPGAPAANKGRFYFRDDGAGKTQFCVQFPTGPVQVLATEP